MAWALSPRKIVPTLDWMVEIEGLKILCGDAAARFFDLPFEFIIY